MTKPQLPMTLVPVFRVIAADLEAFVDRVYKMRDYDFRADTGCAGGEQPEFVVTGNVPPTDGYRERLKQIRAGKRVRRYPGLILEALAMDGYIPVGRYYIDTRPEAALIDQYRELLRRHGGPTAAPCVAFADEHKHDRDFAKRVKTMNSLWGEK
jgi:hypothetical protein